MPKIHGSFAYILELLFSHIETSSRTSWRSFIFPASRGLQTSPYRDVSRQSKSRKLALSEFSLGCRLRVTPPLSHILNSHFSSHFFFPSILKRFKDSSIFSIQHTSILVSVRTSPVVFVSFFPCLPVPLVFQKSSCKCPL